MSCNTGVRPARRRAARRRQGQGRRPQAFGFETDADRSTGDDDNGMPVAASETGDDARTRTAATTRPALAQSCIGQNNVRMTPLQGALIAAAVANNGRQMRPYLVAAAARPGPDHQPLHGRAEGAAPAGRQRRGRRRPAGDDDQRRRERHRQQRRRSTASRSAARPAPRRTREDRAGPRLVHRLRDEGRPAGRRGRACSWRTRAAAAAREAARIAGQVMRAVVTDREGS